METIIESHKIYNNYYNANISITLSYSGGAMPYCTHIKIYGEKIADESQLIHGDYCPNLLKAMDSFKERCLDRIYDSEGNRFDGENYAREWDEIDILCCPKPKGA